MQTYLISYDLKQPADYTSLFEAIRRQANGFCKCLLSTWLICSSASAASIRDALQPYIRSGDELIVVELGKGWATLGLEKGITDWMYKHMPAAYSRTV